MHKKAGVFLLVVFSLIILVFISGVAVAEEHEIVEDLKVDGFDNCGVNCF